MTPLSTGILGRILATVALTAFSQVASSQRIADTARISGVVVDDQTVPAVIARARVTITQPDTSFSASVVAADDGRFLFDGLPHGRFVLTAAKGGFVRSIYGATRSGGLGTTIVLREGERRENLRLTLYRGAVITGTLRDRDGSPLRNVAVRASRRGFLDGRPALMAVPEVSPGVTDGHGVYRIHGLPAGGYLVSVAPPVLTGDPTMRLTSPLQPTGVSNTKPISESSIYATSYYPGTASIAGAVTVDVGPGDERRAIDFHRVLVPAARLGGNVVSSLGLPLTNVRLWMRPASLGASESTVVRASGDGTFAALGVLPGEYVIGGEATVRYPAGSFFPGQSGAPAARTLWARAPVTVTGHDQTGLTLVFQPPLRVIGHVEFDEEQGAPEAKGITIRLVEAGEPVWYAMPTGTVGSMRRFAIEDVAAGQYHLAIEAPAGWMLKSIRAGDADYADQPIEMRPEASAANLAVVFTSRISELAGTLRDQAGRPVTSCSIVIFSTDRAHWTPRSRRIRAVRPDDDGRFLARGLPAGDYLMAAVIDLDDGRWQDPDVLASIAGHGARVTMVDGGRIVQDLRISDVVRSCR